jgi:hypothetical protein
MVTIFLILALIAVRGLETYLFIKKVSKVCHQYDWKQVNNDDMLILEIKEKDYYLTSNWSAYNFMFLKGPSPLSMFFSFKILTIENQYNNEVVEKLRKNEVI